MENASKTCNFSTAFEKGQQSVVQGEYKGVPYLLAPNQMQLHTLEKMVEQQLPRPYRIDQQVNLLTEDSFIDYYNRFASETSTIFVDDESSTFVAVLDYHETPGEAGWKKHRAVYTCPKTKEWNSWTASNNQKMTQEEFALFIEDNLREILEPNGADMLQIASTLKANNNVDFKSGIRLDNGQVQFTYVEQVTGQAGVTGQLAIPEKIKLAVSPFMKGAPYEIEARFRYRIAAGGLTMWYSLIRPHAFVDHAFTEVCEKVKTGMATGYLVHGKDPR